MPKPQIVIQTKEPVYYSGDLINGQVLLTLYEPVGIQSISVNIRGAECVEFFHCDTATWTGKGSNEAFEFYNTTSTLFSHDGTRDAVSGRPVETESGVYQFPFSGMLKSRTPASFSFDAENARACIAYTITATVSVFDDASLVTLFESCLPITVRASNQVPPLVHHFETSKDISFLCCLPRGTTRLAVTLDKNAYRPADLISSHVHLDHSKGHGHLRGLDLKLVQTITFETAKESYRHVHVVETLASPEAILAGQVADRILTLRVPEQCSLSTEGKLIKCQYEIELTVDVPFSSDLTQSVPITIFI